MSVEIQIVPVIDHEQYTVDGFLVYKDQFNNWTCKTDLSDKQLRAFDRYEKNVIKNPRFKKHTKATYKG